MTMAARGVAAGLAMALLLTGPLTSIANAQAPAPAPPVSAPAETPAAPPTATAPTPPPPPPLVPERIKPRDIDEVKVADETRAGIVNIFRVPGKGLLCVIGTGISLAVLGATFGTQYKAANSVFDEGCGGKWIVTGDDVRARPASGAFDWETHRFDWESR